MASLRISAARPTACAGAAVSCRRNVTTAAVRADAGPVARRDVFVAGLTAAALVLVAGGPAEARDYKAALAAKEARKAKLRENATSIKKSGQDKQTFKDSEYEVSEEARTPNVHSRQNEGARTQENV